MLEIRKPDSYAEAAEFIAKMNKKKSSHTGYCGTEAGEILYTLENDFSDFPLDDSLIAAYKDGQLVGILGMDGDQDQKTGELWGPFIDIPEWEDTAVEMWDKLVRQLEGKIEKAFGFYNIANAECRLFMERGAAVKKSEEVILRIAREDVHTNDQPAIEEISEPYYKDFQQLHGESFKNAYYTAAEILDKSDKYNKTFIKTKNGKMAGYVYCEARPKFSEADIHFIAVSPSGRNQGTGRKLINHALSFLFSFEEINNIILCVDAGNKAALKVYRSSGFSEQHRLNFYTLDFKKIEAVKAGQL
ncbi:GNAT family N-acetyltransferase [Evansella sp. LMS18]|jgi:ribosomal protein S18 acetylase RimI-like enzyme|uniref:GNAT family N-acetyltransferase n=1 Tax=Evansella sp. LMS18 TaxID=2924033 RepID=UPI0020D13B4D|nr:N-acetyltransferase [Evansella sp. LMS18]UTR10909.1 GNAT family N-acetyltransferase [Evansella sp. LMS18]